MRLVPPRHPLAILRKALDLHRGELAEMTGCSAETLKSIELGRRKLSEEIAHQISNATYVDVGWLLAGDPKKPITTVDRKPYLFDHFELAQVRRHFPANRQSEELDDALYDFGAGDMLDRLKKVYLKAAKHGREPLFMWRLQQVLDLTEKECVRDPVQKRALMKDMLEPMQYAAEQVSGKLKRRKLKGRRARLGGE